MSRFFKFVFAVTVVFFIFFSCSGNEAPRRSREVKLARGMSSSTLELDRVTAMVYSSLEKPVALSRDGAGEILLVSKDGPTGRYYASRVRKISARQYEIIGEPVLIVGEPIKIGP